jgi:DNA replication protein DnaC
MGPETLEQLLAEGRRRAEGADGGKPQECSGGCGAMLVAPARLCDACSAYRAKERRTAELLEGIPAEYRWARFGSPDLAKRIRSGPALLQARTHLDASRVVFIGDAGAGKTSLAVAMFLERAERVGLRAAFAPCWRLGAARARAEDSDPELLRSALRADLLLLDDLGSERNMPSNPIPDLIFERHAEGRSTWVTTWMKPRDLEERYGDGIARRVFERAIIIDCGAKS